MLLFFKDELQEWCDKDTIILVLHGSAEKTLWSKSLINLLEIFKVK
jgi:hypothetical protein